MIALTDLARTALESVAVRALGWAIFHSLWQGALIAVLLFAGLRLARRGGARLRYLLACLALFLQAALFMVSGVVTYRAEIAGSNVLSQSGPPAPFAFGKPVLALSGAPAPATLSMPAPVIPVSADSPAARESSPPSTPSAVSAPAEPEAMAPAPPVPSSSARLVRADAPTPTPVALPLSRPQASADSSLHLAWQTLAPFVTPLLPWVVSAWAVGVLILSLCRIREWIFLQRLKRLAEPAGPVLEAVLARLAATMGVRRSVRLVQSALVQVPAVAGYLKPVILLPASALTAIPADHLEAILAHELAHVRRHDYLVNLLQTLIELLLFHSPAVWWISSRIRVEREFCCDDLAVAACGDPVAYSRALADLEESRSPSRIALAANDGSLLSRVRRLLLPSSGVEIPRRRSLGAALTAAIVAGGACLLMTVACTPSDGPRQDYYTVEPEMRRTFPDGSVVEILTVEWLDPTLGPNLILRRSADMWSDGKRPVKVVARLKGGAPSSSVELRIIEADGLVNKGWGSAHGTTERGPGVSIWVIPLAKDTRRTTVSARLGSVHSRRPQLLAAFPVQAGKLVTSESNGIRFFLEPEPEKARYKHFRLEVTDHRYDGWSLQVKSVTKDGNSGVAHFGTVQNGQASTSVSSFPGAIRFEVEGLPPEGEKPEVLFSNVEIAGPMEEQLREEKASVGALAATLADGSRIELVGIRDPHRTGRGWWKPDGKADPRHYPLLTGQLTTYRFPEPAHSREMLFRYLGKPGRKISFRTPGSFLYHLSGGFKLDAKIGDKNKFGEEEVLVPGLVELESPISLGRKTGFEVEVGDVDWKPVASFPVEGWTTGSRSINGLSLDAPEGTDRDPANPQSYPSVVLRNIRADERYRNNQIRFRYVWKNGDSYGSTTSLGIEQAAPFDTSTSINGPAGPSDLDRIDVEARGAEVVAFRDVSLRRDVETSPWVEILKPVEVGEWNTRDRNDPTPPRERPFARFSDGSEFELIAVAQRPTGPVDDDQIQWWGADGTRLARLSPQLPQNRVMEPQEGLRFMFLTTGPITMTYRVQVPGFLGTGGGEVSLLDHLKDRFEYVNPVPGFTSVEATTRIGRSDGTVRIGVPINSFTTHGVYLKGDGGWQKWNRPGFEFRPPFAGGSLTTLDVGVVDRSTFDPYQGGGEAVAVAIDIYGNRFPVSGGISQAGHKQTGVIRFSWNLALENIVAFELLSRPIEWGEFRNIALNPEEKTAPEFLLGESPAALPRPGTELPALDWAISRVVFDPVGQEAVPHALVEVYPADTLTTRPIAIGKAREDGWFWIPVPPGEYRLRASSGERKGIMSPPRSATPRGRSGWGGIPRVLLREGPIIRGTLIDTKSNTGVAGVLLTAGQEFVAETAADGSFALGPVPAGTWEVSVSDPGWVQSRLLVDTEGERPEEIVLPTRPGLTIRGQVTEYGKTPIAGARVMFRSELKYPENTFNTMRETVTDGEGRYSVGGFDPDSPPRSIVVESAGHSRGEWPLSNMDTPNRVITADASLARQSGGLSEEEKSVQPLRRVIGRVVRREDNRPLERARVATALYPGGENYLETFTDAEGDYTLDLPGGSATPPYLFASVEGRAPQGIVVEPGRESADFSLAVGYRLRGRVVDGDGNPLSAAVLYPVTEDPTTSVPLNLPPVVADEEGRFLIEDLPTTRVIVRAAVRGDTGFRSFEGIAGEEEREYRATAPQPPPPIVSTLPHPVGIPRFPATETSGASPYVVRVMDGVSSAPVSGALVLFYRRTAAVSPPPVHNPWLVSREAPFKWEMVNSGQTDSVGEMRFNPRPGEWLIRAVARQGKPDEAVGYRTLLVGVMGAPEEDVAELVIPKNGSAVIRLNEGTDGTPVTEATVQAVDEVGMILYPEAAPGRPWGSRSDVGPDGVALFPALPPGKYRFVTTSARHRLDEFSIEIPPGGKLWTTAVLNPSGRLVFRLNEPIYGPDGSHPFIGFRIVHTDYRTTGVLKDARGAADGDYLPMSHNVYISDQEGTPRQYPALRPVPLPPGEYEVQAGFRLEPGYSTRSATTDLWTIQTTVRIPRDGDVILDITPPPPAPWAP